ncbi:ABC transporter substrate-binding protein [Marinobacterium aestuariivivens]|uniref:ABC transporter substrate-binding protein n=1 Tax=Marinobacterium aestuariivivens TaxID=1698799 RepID=A0ABW1ZZA6_9GAMM
MKKLFFQSRKLMAVSALAAAVGSLSPLALAADGKLVVVTSFPSDLTKIFKAAFEAENPGIELEVLNKKTSASIKYIEETAGNNKSDLFWASAPDAFEVLKGKELLEQYRTRATGIPETIGAFPIHDPDGYYSGFAAAGYGIMWNERYLKAKNLPAPAEWSDLEKPVYFEHVGMSAPSRSGTTHLTVETILQGEGWNEGWATLKRMAGNFKSVTERSFGVPDGVNSGNFGIGVVIDFFGLSSKGAGFPVEFKYPSTTALVPANIGIVKNAPNRESAVDFIEFLLSDKGQELLLDPKIRRLPVNPKTYEKAPAGFPNPFNDGELSASLHFDLDTSKSRYNLVNALFDVMITYRMDDLRRATKQIHDAEAMLAKSPNVEAAQMVGRAKDLIAQIPVTEDKAADPEFLAAFTSSRKKATDKTTGRQAEIEAMWDEFARNNYREAAALAEQAQELL